MDDIVILVAASGEEVRALASARNYKILYSRSFDSLNTDTVPAGAYGHIQSGSKGVVAIAMAE